VNIKRRTHIDIMITKGELVELLRKHEAGSIAVNGLPPLGKDVVMVMDAGAILLTYDTPPLLLS